MKTEKGEKYRDVTLILAGDYLYYINRTTDRSLYLILLSDAKMYQSSEKGNTFEIRSNNRSFVIKCKSEHDMDNWVSAIIEKIKHVKCKHEIFDLNNGIHTI
jgi:hypothetical protein